MSIKCNVSTSRCPPPRISYPFMWQSEGGCTYLRNADGSDVIIAPRICDQKVGKVCLQNKNDFDAWDRRLPPGSTVTLTQAD